jgi:hypothetical protein
VPIIVGCYSNTGQTRLRPEMSAKCKSRPMHCSKQHSYSITSSAVAMSVGGTMKPSALVVVFRLMTNSYVVGALLEHYTGLTITRGP